MIETLGAIILVFMNNPGEETAIGLGRSTVCKLFMDAKGLDMKEIEELRKQLLTNDYKYTAQILKFSDTAHKEFEKMFKGVNRPYRFEFYSEESNEYTKFESFG